MFTKTSFYQFSSWCCIAAGISMPLLYWADNLQTSTVIFASVLIVARGLEDLLFD